MNNEKTFLPPNLGLAPFCKSRGMTLQIAQLQQALGDTERHVIGYGTVQISQSLEPNTVDFWAPRTYRNVLQKRDG